jgi:hypothetical protein
MLYNFLTWFQPINWMSLRPGRLWLILNLALIIHCLSWNNIYVCVYCNFTYPVRCFRVPPKMTLFPGVRIPQVEDHKFRPLSDFLFFSFTYQPKMSSRTPGIRVPRVVDQCSASLQLSRRMGPLLIIAITNMTDRGVLVRHCRAAGLLAPSYPPPPPRSCPHVECLA